MDCLRENHEVLKHVTLQSTYGKKEKAYRKYVDINREDTKFASAELFNKRLDQHGLNPGRYPLEEMA